MKKYIIGYIFLIIIFALSLYYCRLEFAFSGMNEYTIISKYNMCNDFWYKTLFIYIPIIIIGFSTIGIYANKKTRTISTISILIYIFALQMLCTR